MKMICGAALGVILIVTIASCSKKENSSSVGSSEIKIFTEGRKPILVDSKPEWHEKIGPPFSMQVSADYSPGNSYVPVTVEIIPIIDLDGIELIWSLPDGVLSAMYRPFRGSWPMPARCCFGMATQC